MSSVNFLEKLLCGVEVEWIPLEQLIHSLNRLLKYYPYGRTCSAAASAFVAAVSVF